MKLIIIHGHKVESLIFDCIYSLDLYILNYQWKKLRKLCSKAGLTIYGYPSVSFLYIPDEDGMELWEKVWNKWSSETIISTAFSWDVFSSPGRKKIVELLSNYQKKLNKDYSFSYPYKPFFKECDMCHKTPSDIRYKRKFLCLHCSSLYKKKERILSYLNIPYKNLMLLQISFSLWKNILTCREERLKDPGDLFRYYKEITGSLIAFCRSKDNNRRGFLLHEDIDQLVFIMDKRYLFNFIDDFIEIIFKDKSITPSNIMITVTGNINTEEVTEEREHIKIGEFLLFCSKRFDTVKRRSIEWHMQWIYSQDYIKMPKYLYDFTDNLDRNSFRLLKDCLHKLHILFSIEDIRILKDIFQEQYEVNDNTLESLKSIIKKDDKLKVLQDIKDSKLSKQELTAYLKKLRLSKGLVRIVLDHTLIPYDEIEGSIIYDLSRFQFLCNTEQKEFIEFLYKTIGYIGIRNILKYERYLERAREDKLS
jgi:hypothetical protein